MTHVVHDIYVVGRVPIDTEDSCLGRQGDSRDWYVAGYYEGLETPFHPWGSNFIVAPWTDDEPIDAYNAPYRRYRMAEERL